MPFSKPSFIPIKLLVALGMVLSSFGIAVRPAYAAACQAGTPGCVLPVGVTPPPMAEAPPPPAPIVDDYDDGKSIGWLPILLGLLAAGALAYFLFIDDDDDDDGPVSP